ncbi:MAG: PSD1 and planctomycete cytochrome C domain-containing protein [Limisphaerales bacterium]
MPPFTLTRMPVPGSLRRTALSFVAIALLLVGGPTHAAVDFSKEIEPILVKRCSECHGADQQKANLRLDSRPSALAPAKSGKPAVVPGRPDQSELLVRVLSTDADEVMPPKGAPLTTEETDALKRWIEEGAEWPASDPSAHWAFRAPVRPLLPSPETGGTWGFNEIDPFILARLEAEGLSPRPEADRATLIRRLSLDLTGLPPAWRDVEAFLADTSDRAYERLVDRLLASPHYGEHMARGWLDLARYADSNGYQVDLARSIWPYRDWVIRAFNDNMRFDQFTIEQLAGDLLPDPTTDQRIATGFNRNTKINDEGGGDAEEYRTKAVKDRVATLGTAWLGLTLNCAECHTHKYDPVTHEEYYRLYAFFNNTTDGGNYSAAPSVPVPKPDLSDTFDHLKRRLAKARADRAALDAGLAVRQEAWEARARTRGDVWRTLNLTNALSTGGSSYTNLSDGSVLATGVNPIYDTITVEATTDLTGIRAVLLEVLPDPSLPKNGPGRWRQTGNFILDEFALTLEPASGGAGAKPVAVVFADATADWEQQYYRAEHAVDRNPKTGWAIGPRFGERHFLVARLPEPAGFEGGSRLTFRFEHYHGNSHCVGRFRISVATEADQEALWPLPAEIRAIVGKREGDRTSEEAGRLANHYRSSLPEVRALEREIIRLEDRERELSAKSYSTLVIAERGEPEPRPSYVHVRGNFLEKGRAVTPGVPEAFPGLPPGAPANRLGLAKWLVDPANPLTARVTVNRLWEQFFGTGLVKTSEDFGRQGEPPSHPELLDWLATEFLAVGWDVKAMQKRIVMSAAYRQGAAADDIRLEKDPYNRLLSRGPRFRMDAEMIRDHALAVSGLLNPKVGGPSVYPVQIPNLWKEIGFLRPEIGMDEWPVSEGPDLYRRAVYTFWRRVCTYPTFATFDAPSRDVCVARRPRTNTPLQALAGLNDPTFLEAARVFAQRVIVEGGATDGERLRFAFRTCLGRLPTVGEEDRLRAFLDQQIQGYRNDLPSAETLVGIGSAKGPGEADPRSVAAWMMVANVLFNLDETLTKG